MPDRAVGLGSVGGLGGVGGRMRIIVQKFGGTSVSTAERRARVADLVSGAAKQGLTPVVVVSAMGRGGDPYATDTLVSLARGVHAETAPRELDLLMSCGEIISAVIMVNTLREHGLEAMAMTGGQAGIVTDLAFTQANIVRMDTDHLLRHLREGKVVVVAGFQGRTDSGDITTLGRGGSDTTAAALGAALDAELIEIFTDVEGVLTADPRLVPDARTLSVVGYDEVAQMAHLGAKVIHPAAVEIAMSKGVPIRVRSTFSDSPGTLIVGSAGAGKPWTSTGLGPPVTAVTHIPAVSLVRVEVGEDDGGEAELRIFDLLARAGVSVDLINVSPGVKSFIVKTEELPQARAAIGQAGYAPVTRDNCAKVSVVGSGMRGVPGVMANVVKALKRAGVPILQTSDSHVTISCLIPMEGLERAVRALHEQFGLAGEDGPRKD